MELKKDLVAYKPTEVIEVTNQPSEDGNNKDFSELYITPSRFDKVKEREFFIDGFLAKESIIGFYMIITV